MLVVVMAIRQADRVCIKQSTSMKVESTERKQTPWRVIKQRVTGIRRSPLTVSACVTWVRSTRWLAVTSTSWTSRLRTWSRSGPSTWRRRRANRGRRSTRTGKRPGRSIRKRERRKRWKKRLRRRRTQRRVVTRKNYTKEVVLIKTN